MVRGGCVFFSSAHREIATLDFFAALARHAPRQSHIFGLSAAADCLPRQDVNLALGLMPAPGALSLLQIGFGGAQLIRRITFGARVTRQIDCLARAEQRYRDVAIV